MEDRTDKQTDNNKEQYIRDTLAAEDFAEEMCSENEQTDNGDGQPDLSRGTAVGDLFCDRVNQARIGNGFGDMSDSVVDSRKRVGCGYKFGLHHKNMLLVEQSPVDTNKYTAVAHRVVGRNE